MRPSCCAWTVGAMSAVRCISMDGIGGGVMGLMTAYYAAPLAEAVTVLERSQVGDPATASDRARGGLPRWRLAC